MWSIGLLLVAMVGTTIASPVSVTSADLDGTGAPVYTESGIAGLAAAQEHVVSSLTGGLYIQADQPQRLSTGEAGLVKAEGGAGWVRIKRRRHLDY